MTYRIAHMVLALALAGRAWGQGPAPTSLSQADALALALESNPGLLAVRQERTVMEARVPQAALLASPEIRIGVADVVTDLLTERRQNNVGLRWSPPRIGEIGLNTGMARARVAEIDGAVGVAEVRLAAEVRVTYRTLCLLSEQLRVAEEQVRVRERIAKDVGSQVEAGVKNALDRSAAEIALAESRVLPAQYRAERRIQLIRLSQKLGVTLAENVVLTDAPEALTFAAPSLERSALLTTAFEKRPELASAAAACEYAKLNLTAVRNENYPWLSFVQVTRRSRSTLDPADWGFQVGIEVPVFRWFSGATQAASAELERCRLRERAARSTIAAEVDEVIARVQAASADLESIRKEMVALSEREVGLAEDQLAAGRADRVEPLLAGARLLGARQAYLTKLGELHALEAGLDQAVGRTGQ